MLKMLWVLRANVNYTVIGRTVNALRKQIKKGIGENWRYGDILNE